MNTTTLITQPAVDTTVTDSTVFLDITLNGSRIFGVQNLDAGSWLWGTLTGIIPVDPGTYGYNRPGSVFSYQGLDAAPGFAFGKGNYNNFPELYNSATLPVNFVDSFFAPANYNYSVATHDTTYSYLLVSATDTVLVSNGPATQMLLTPGINILWNDSTGTIWQTFKGTGIQTGSYFTITSVKTIQANPLVCQVSAIFACKLYDGNGNVINLTNGKFRLNVYL